MVKTIEFGGEERPVKYGWNAICEFGDLTGIGLEDLSEDKDFSLSQIRALVYAGLKEGARAKGEKFELSIEGVGDLLHEDIDIIAEFIEVFVSQMPESKKKKAP